MKIREKVRVSGRKPSLFACGNAEDTMIKWSYHRNNRSWVQMVRQFFWIKIIPKNLEKLNKDFTLC